MNSCLLLAVLAMAVGSVGAATTTTTTTTTSPPVRPSPQPVLPPLSSLTAPPEGAAGAAQSADDALPAHHPASPGTGQAEQGRGDRPQPHPPPAPAPVWVQCLSGGPLEGSLPELFQHWCSNYNQIIPCIAAGLSTESARNPLDQFLQLHFNSEQMTARSAELCAKFQGLSSAVQCTQQNNASVEGWCHARFSQGQQYVFAVRAQRAFNDDLTTYRQLACQVVNDTTGCLASAMTGCDVEVKRHLLAFYTLFADQSCLADPSAEYTTPVLPPPDPVPSRDVVVTCARRIAKILTPDPPSQNASQLDQLLYGLQHNCRTFETRYTCYDEELSKVSEPSFRDIWLSFTFDSNNAVRSQHQFCQAFEGGIADSLTTACYNDTRPMLEQCEEGYGQTVVSLQHRWLRQQLDNVALHKAACRTSMQRAFCLRNAFKQCGEDLAEAMLSSELHTLPNICLSLLPHDNHDQDSDSDKDSEPTAPNRPPSPGDSQEPAAESEPVGRVSDSEGGSFSSPSDSAEQNEDDLRSIAGESSEDRSPGQAMDKDRNSVASGSGYHVLVMVFFTGMVSLSLLL